MKPAGPGTVATISAWDSTASGQARPGINISGHGRSVGFLDGMF
jgi:hypothetical protein